MITSYEDGHYAMEFASYTHACEADRYEPTAPCPHCFESSGFYARVHPATWWEPSWADADPTSPCEECRGTGSVPCDEAQADDWLASWSDDFNSDEYLASLTDEHQGV